MRIGGLDFLRLFCAAVVFAFHALYLFVLTRQVPWTTTPEIMAITQYGYLGVQVFFMISGYVIPMSVSGKSRFQFLVGRAARLLPAFWICLALTVAALSVAGRPPVLAQLAANIPIIAIMFGQPYIDGVFWSLTAEIIFYSWIFALAGSHNFPARLRVFALAWLAWAVVDFVVDLPLDGISNALWAPYFAIGIFIFLDQNGAKTFDRAMICVAVAIAAAFAWKQAVGLPFAQTSGLNPVVVSTIIMLMAATAFFVVRVPMQGRGLNVAIVCGAISYPLYLIHAEFGSILMSAVWRSAPEIIPLAPAAILAISYVVTRLEKPIAAYIRRIAPRR